MSLRHLTLSTLAVTLLVLVSCRPKTVADTTDEDSIEQSSDTLVTEPEDTLTEYEEAVEELSMPKKRIEAFSDFFFAFLNNHRFQAERVKFPFAIEEADGEQRTITSGRNFRAFFSWPHADEYCLLLNNEEQMEELQNSLELTDVTVQLIDLATAHVRDFVFQRQAEEWRCMRAHEHQASGTQADFLHFYHQFTTDSVFQEQSLAHELHYSMSDPDDESEAIEGTLEVYQWDSFRPELPSGRITNILFGQQLENAQQIVLMHCGTANGMMDTFYFRRHNNGRWRLVSFKN